MEEKIAKHRQMMEFWHSHLMHNIFDYCMRRFFFGLVYVRGLPDNFSASKHS